MLCAGGASPGSFVTGLLCYRPAAHSHDRRDAAKLHGHITVGKELILERPEGGASHEGDPRLVVGDGGIPPLMITCAELTAGAEYTHTMKYGSFTFLVFHRLHSGGDSHHLGGGAVVRTG